jgi:hypothetical protein
VTTSKVVVIKLKEKKKIEGKETPRNESETAREAE